jgi:hypothetical protein
MPAFAGMTEFRTFYEFVNIGFWNIGMVGLENQNEYNCIDILVILAYFLGPDQKMDFCTLLIKTAFSRIPMM